MFCLFFLDQQGHTSLDHKGEEFLDRLFFFQVNYQVEVSLIVGIERVDTLSRRRPVVLGPRARRHLLVSIEDPCSTCCTYGEGLWWEGDMYMKLEAKKNQKTETSHMIKFLADILSNRWRVGRVYLESWAGTMNWTSSKGLGQRSRAAPQAPPPWADRRTSVAGAGRDGPHWPCPGEAFRSTSVAGSRA